MVVAFSPEFYRRWVEWSWIWRHTARMTRVVGATPEDFLHATRYGLRRLLTHRFRAGRVFAGDWRKIPITLIDGCRRTLIPSGGLQLFDRGELSLQVGTVLPLQEVRAAHQMLAGARHKRGKIVLQVTA